MKAWLRLGVDGGRLGNCAVLGVSCDGNDEVDADGGSSADDVDDVRCVSVDW